MICVVYFVDVEKLCIECLFKCEYKNELCGLMYFFLDNEVFVCGYFYYSMDWYDGWVFDIELLFIFLFILLDEFLWLVESMDFFFWFIELMRLMIGKLIFEGLFFSCVSRVFLFL